jgi:hypothetical protein
MPSHDCILAISGAQASGDIYMKGILSTGRPEQKDVIRGDYSKLKDPVLP